jgi:predicted ABC-type transport system involved in lysophospholipase L1 biosynthesis ATPase subunit
MAPLISLENVTKRFASDERAEVTVLRDVSFAVEPQESIGVVGLERAGKSTLLRLLAGLVRPDAGVVRFEGRALDALSSEQQATLRRSCIGLADPTAVRSTRCERVVDLVALPLLSAGRTIRGATVVARRTLDRVGATDCADLLPHELTRSELTRVAIARALVRDPRLLLVDEPAAMPSAADIESITRMVRALARDRRIALVMASQDPLALRGADRIVHLTDGELRTSATRGTVVELRRARNAS